MYFVLTSCFDTPRNTSVGPVKLLCTFECILFSVTAECQDTCINRNFLLCNLSLLPAWFINWCSSKLMHFPSSWGGCVNSPPLCFYFLGMAKERFWTSLGLWFLQVWIYICWGFVPSEVSHWCGSPNSTPWGNLLGVPHVSDLPDAAGLVSHQ